MSMQKKKEVPFVGDVDVTKIVFGPYETIGGKQKVSIYRDSSSTQRNNMFHEVNFCADAAFPMATRYPLDEKRKDDKPVTNDTGDAKGDRRGLAIKVEDPRAVSALLRLDEKVVEEAIKQSKTWFKRELTREQVLARYKPVLSKKDDDEPYVMKIKVKIGGVKPTDLHLAMDSGRIRKKAGRPEDLNWGAHVVPICSFSYGLWFMGGGTSFGVSFQAEDMIVIPGATEGDSLSKFASSIPLEVSDEEPDGKRRQVELAGDEYGDDEDAM